MIRALILFLLSAGSLFSQQYRVGGVIVNQDNTPVSYVNVVLLNQKDSVFVSGTSTDEKGVFNFQNINKGSYILRASFIGYNDFYKELTLESDVDFGKITLKEASEFLDEITISIQKPTIQREIDRLIFNVENTSLSNGTTMDILNRTPGVIVQNNSISVQNQPATIYINDRKVNLSSVEIQSLLGGFAGSNVKSIEVITKPGARYDADSGMIINIVTSKAFNPGYKGSLTGGFEQAVFPKYNLGTSQYYKNEKLNFLINYNYRKRKEHKNDLSEITFFEADNTTNSFWETDFLRITHSEAHSVNSFIDYSISDKTTLGLSSLISYFPKTTFLNREKTDIFNPNKQLDSLFTTQSGVDSNSNNVALDFSVNHNFNENGTSLKFNAHYTNFINNRSQNVNTEYFLPNLSFLRRNSFLTDSKQGINIYVGQLDLTTRLFEIPVEMGVKTSFINTESSIDFFNILNGTQQFNSLLSDNFKYEENVFAGYFSFSKNWNKWKFRVGLRAEYTQTTGNSISLAQKTRNEYLDWFPNLILNFIPNHNHSLKFSYNKNIQRPNYSLLNPFSYFINENNFTTGDPNLQPATSETYRFEYVAQSKYIFEFYYRITQGAVDVLSFQNNENRFLRSVSTNIEDKRGYGFEFKYFSHIRDWWTFYHYNSLFYEENSFLAIESGNELVTIGSSGMLTQFVNSFTFSKDKSFSGSLVFMHLTGLAAGNYLMDDFTLVNVSLRKSLWDNKASLSLTINDIFNTFNRRLNSDFLNQRNSYFAITESRYLNVGFIYNFGNYRLKDNARETSNEQRERI